MNFAEAGFWFLFGFCLASWLAWRQQKRQRDRATRSFQAAKSEVLRLLDSVRDLTEVRVTIVDQGEEIEIETEEKKKSGSERVH